MKSPLSSMKMEFLANDWNRTRVGDSFNIYKAARVGLPSGRALCLHEYPRLPADYPVGSLVQVQPVLAVHCVRAFG